jgi:hypothetical protein
VRHILVAVAMLVAALAITATIAQVLTTRAQQEVEEP